MSSDQEEISPNVMKKTRWAFSLCTVAYGMAFNGFIYGYTSPALPGLLRSNLTEPDTVDHF